MGRRTEVVRHKERAFGALGHPRLAHEPANTCILYYSNVVLYIGVWAMDTARVDNVGFYCLCDLCTVVVLFRYVFPYAPPVATALSAVEWTLYSGFAALPTPNWHFILDTTNAMLPQSNKANKHYASCVGTSEVLGRLYSLSSTATPSPFLF